MKKPLLVDIDSLEKIKKDIFMNRSLSWKFKTIYIFIILLFMICNITVIRFFYHHETKKAISALASQTLETISQNADNTIRIISKTSTYMLGSSDIQNYLNKTAKGQNSTLLSRNLRNALYLSLESMPAAESIMILDENGNSECAARYTMPHAILSSPREADWYDEVHRLQGAPVFLINGGGYFAPNGDNNYLSLIRLVNSTEDVRPLGYMIINIPLNELFAISNTKDTSYSDICVYSGSFPVLQFSNSILAQFFSENTISGLFNLKEEEVVVGGDKYLLLGLQNSSLDMHYFSATRFASHSSEFKPFLLIFLFTVFIGTSLFLLIALCTSHFVTIPLYRLSVAMKKTEQGDFHPAYVTSHKDEIGQLQDAYNEMVDKIELLLSAKISEQKKLRKAELKILQEQIKPHFLYNSLSGIAYLITDKQNTAACDMVISLSEYYRESLSKGSEVISLSTEVNIVKNYLKLQKMRFPGQFEDIYEVEEDILTLTIPRLVLQPLVENSLYHGILPTGDFGTIHIRAYHKNHFLMLHIQDDGIGIDHEQLSGIMNDTLESNRKSFGLRGTVERLQIYYADKNIYEIISAPGEGCEIIFSLPLDRSEN